MLWFFFLFSIIVYLLYLFGVRFGFLQVLHKYCMECSGYGRSGKRNLSPTPVYYSVLHFEAGYSVSALNHSVTYTEACVVTGDRAHLLGSAGLLQQGSTPWRSRAHACVCVVCVNEIIAADDWGKKPLFTVCHLQLKVNTCADLKVKDNALGESVCCRWNRLI